MYLIQIHLYIGQKAFVLDPGTVGVLLMPMKHHVLYMSDYIVNRYEKPFHFINVI